MPSDETKTSIFSTTTPAAYSGERPENLRNRPLQMTFFNSLPVRGFGSNAVGNNCNPITVLSPAVPQHCRDLRTSEPKMLGVTKACRRVVRPAVGAPAHQPGARSRAVGVEVPIDPNMEAQPIQHLNDLSCLSLGQQVDLQAKIIPAIGGEAHSVLLRQHERHQQYRLQRGNRTITADRGRGRRA
jgi:hypothetical protein